MGAAVVGAVLATLAWSPQPRLVWNASASSPLGLYGVEPGQTAGPGEMVVAWPPASARALGAARHYLPRNVPMVKRVFAAAGDRVCARGERISVNGRAVARRRAVDPSGRWLPWWSGCTELGAGDLFLLAPEVPDAFDGRYFGVTHRALVVGRARLLWAR